MAVVHPYIPNSAPQAKRAMLAAVQAESVEDFYAEIPSHLRFDGVLDLPPAILTEHELRRHFTQLISVNTSSDEVLSFLGQGTYPHAVPAVVTEVINRGEFLTAYAGEPYEDHGRFQALWEYTSQLAEVLQTDVVTVPTYDGYQATATSLAIAGRATGRRRVLQVSDVLDDKLARVRDFVDPHLDLVPVAPKDGVADLDAARSAVADDLAAIWVESPSAHGAVEPNLRELAALAHSVGALLIVGTDPIVHGVLEPPAGQGADITCGDIQSLGLGQWFGGAHAGFIAMADDPRLVMELPARLFGLVATSVPGEYGFGDVAYERTSFAVREDGKEWVGTAAALWGIAAGVYLSLMGPDGMAELGETLVLRTRYAQTRLADAGFPTTDDALHIREFRVRTPVPAAELVAAARSRGVEPGVVTGEHLLTICITEIHTQADIDLLVATLAAAAKEN